MVNCAHQNKTNEQNPQVLYSSFGGSPVDLDSERKYTLMEREIEYLMDIWEGDYDNVEQLSLESDRGMKEQSQGQHTRIHTTVSKIKNDLIGEYLLYIKEYENNDPKNIFREYLYQLIPEDSTAQIRVKAYQFKSDINSRTVKSLSKLKLNSLEAADDCDIWIHREGRSFIGRTSGASCGLDIVKGVSLSYHVKITENQYAFKYTQNFDNGQRQSVNENWYLLDKARCFVCMIDFPREEGGRPVETKHYIEIHDQGGQFDFGYTDGRHMVLTMRNTWSYGMKRNTFVIVIQENDLKGKTLIYSWGEDVQIG